MSAVSGVITAEGLEFSNLQFQIRIKKSDRKLKVCMI